MTIRLRPLHQQVMVITGASSGIGLATRNRLVLNRIVDEITERGGRATCVTADVSRFPDVRRIAEHAINQFGRIDTWVNNAAVSIYGKVVEVSLQDHRRLFEVNYWGYVYGMLIAYEQMRRNGGSIINLASVLADRSIPMQGPYCATKAAIKNLTDSFRMELEREHIPISVSLIKPSAIDTPYKDHARNYMDVKAQNPPPVYAPQLVAKAILHCAEHVQRDLYVGGGGRLIAAIGNTFPTLTDHAMKQLMAKLQRTDKPVEWPDEHALYKP
jgi:NAD(P)-dependent dehydrogenase (short-subunit alcohol dehydrogenase family)